MKLILALLLGALCGATSAQTTSPPVLCPGLPAPTASSPVMTDATSFACAPAPFGTGTTPFVRTPPGGIVAWWFCPLPNNRWQPSMAVAEDSWFNSSTMVSALRAAAAASDPTSAVNAMMKANKSKTIIELAPVWCPVWTEFMASIPPAPATYIVAKSGTSTTRPAYMVVNGSLVASTVRAPVGAACTNPAKVGTGTTLYGTFVGAPSPQTVTVCVKAP